MQSPNSSTLLCLALTAALSGHTLAGTLDPVQKAWIEKYQKQENAPDPATQLLNTDPEPDLKEGFTPMFNGKDLTGWTPRGGKAQFEVKDGMIIGTFAANSPSTYLCSTKDDYTDFVFTCEMKWEQDINSGVMFRAQSKTEKGNTLVFGPQAEMEGITGDRGWSGGIYGQDCGGYFYPLWLTDHAKARTAIDKTGWNRLTIQTKGNVVKTWINGIPAAHWVDNSTYAKGFFGLQIHHANRGKVLWRNVMIHETP